MTCPACGIDPSLLLAAHAIVRVRADREQNPALAHHLGIQPESLQRRHAA